MNKSGLKILGFKRGGNVPARKYDKGGYSESEYPKFFESGQKKRKKRLDELEKDTQDYEYGGFWFKKGYESQIGLIEFYKKFGFYDEPKVHLDWNCFEKEPFPSMICPL